MRFPLQPNSQATKDQSLIGLTREKLGETLLEAGVTAKQVKMRTQQLWHWLYIRGVDDFDLMSNLGKELRALLKEKFTIGQPEIVEEQKSVDGTCKWLIRFPPRGAGKPVEIETVYIPEEGRGTLCVSSQVGCTLTCTFCHTGTQTLVRNLTASEIVAQVVLARKRLGDFPEIDTPAGAIVPSEGRKVTNVVMMGMGEPLYNYEHVRDAMNVFSDGDGLSLSKRRITLSTSGVVVMAEFTRPINLPNFGKWLLHTIIGYIIAVIVATFITVLFYFHLLCLRERI
ncbi:Dual-specificity RNA methyltransferase RlmN [Nymphon striatum]|nr:Dual-specificity RNA methyltransferase RlmN [Nymphon striatum]